MVHTLPSPRSPRPRTPPAEPKQKFATLGRLFKPWKWKRKKKSDKFAETQRSLERKISMRSNRDDLIQKGILIPDNASSSPGSAAPASEAPDLLKERDLLNGAARASPPARHPTPPPAAEPPPPRPPPPRPERPASLGGQLTPAPAPAVPVSAQRPVSVPAAVLSRPPPGAPLSVGVRPEPRAEPRVPLSGLPEPPIGVTEVGLIPPPAMFSGGGAATPAGASVNTAAPLDLSDTRFDHLQEEEEVALGDDDDDDEYYPMCPAGVGRGDEPRQPRTDLAPLKSALKKPRPPAERHPAAVPAGADGAQRSLLLAGGGDAAEDSDGDSDGPIPYRDEPAEGESGVLTRLGSRVQRSDSLALKLALRPARQELIDRNIIHAQTEQDRCDWRSELSAKLNRRLSLRPTAEELEGRNILKTMTPEEAQREMESRKATLLRKLSFRPTVEELKQRKVIHFNEYVDVTEAHEYDRRADKPWTRLTPRDKAIIRQELNEFKSSEMDVHEASRHLTRFHRP